MTEDLFKHIKNFPDSCGVYLMKDEDGQVIYVGKAKVLKNRVKSYFNKEDHSPKIQVMLPKINDIDYITTTNELEALILEDTLIKKYQPKYNTLLKDDKKFPWIKITDEEYPRLIVTRKISPKRKGDKSRYYGPYVNVSAMYSILDFLKKVFPLKQCKKPLYTNRPCINYQIGRCSGICQKLITSEQYNKIIKNIELFLLGKQKALMDDLKIQMKKESDLLNFEKAAQLRDVMTSIEKISAVQNVVSDNVSLEQDIFNFAADNVNVAIVLFRIREGKLYYKETFDFKIDVISSPEEILWAFIRDYYDKIEVDQIPKEIILPCDYEEKELFSLYLSKKKNRKIKISVPRSGRSLDLLNIAKDNVDNFLNDLKLKSTRDVHSNWSDVGLEIQQNLKLEKFPSRVECFDISHLSGQDTVASMVVFENGLPKKSDYRKYKIDNKGNIDDFRSMAEVVERRYSKILKENLLLPDLIIVDGGKGQLSFALNSLKKLKWINPPIVSLAKRLEEVFIPASSLPIVFDPTSLALSFFQQIRDEAHRSAISFQRVLRSKRMKESKLDKIDGIGQVRKTLLLQHFKSIDNILKADKKELAKVKGLNINLVEKIYQELHNNSNL